MTDCDLEAWLRQVNEELRAGELLQAFDTAQRGLEQHPGALPLRVRALQALCRADVTEHAAELYNAWELDQAVDHDAMALSARIAKNRAGRARGADQRNLYRRAGAAYKAVFDRYGGHYPAVNAATTFLFAGDTDLAHLMAERCLATTQAGAGEHPAERYYSLVSRAEALLVLGDDAGAAEHVRMAADMGFADLSARASTRRQMRRICRLRGIDDGPLLSPLAPPRVVHFAGHRIFDAPEARFPMAQEDDARAAIRHAIAKHDVGLAVGSLAAGADILFAEALLDAGADLTVVLPCARQAFVPVSVAPSGSDWVRRFDACLERAHRVIEAGDDRRLDHDSAFDYCSRVSMGLALLQAAHIDADPLQITLWDGVDNGQDVGTEADIRTWAARGLEAQVVPVTSSYKAPTAATPMTDAFEQRMMAMMFADAQGFSRLTNDDIRRFHARVTHRVATVLDRFDDHVLDRNTWGDGLFVLFDDVSTAAEVATTIQQTLKDDAADLGDAAAEAFRLRMSLHAGPVFAYDDPVRGCRSYTGRHVTRAARLEPIATLGDVFVTESLAALLALQAPDRFACEYVGHRTRAKAAGTERMFSLRALPPGGAL